MYIMIWNKLSNAASWTNLSFVLESAVWLPLRPVKQNIQTLVTSAVCVVDADVVCLSTELDWRDTFGRWRFGPDSQLSCLICCIEQEEIQKKPTATNSAVIYIIWMITNINSWSDIGKNNDTEDVSEDV